ncbi:AAA family ATPase [Polaromonas sp.]|uniref:AAA family ATPase n=1 Tax=Polaromonas sp. TaxID=1869339 RepID=UPI00248A5247|nr:AAA family ATPase [Polaromonas sp.]MDI1271955.1 AAA family ATPase [Polaromonas sp.]
MINFPVLDRVSVQNFGMYPGTSDTAGLDHSFVPGVNIIVGINGLGKTTLLNILLRSLTGPFDLPGGDELGGKKRRLVPADRLWFRRRVKDDAVDATATIWFHIGERFFEVKRSLANLDILSLTIDQQLWPAARASELEATYQQQTSQAAGLSSFDDFVFLLRYVVFFLEDRRTLVWDASAQGDILGILFGDQSADRRHYVELFNELLSKDSEYRNMLAVVNKRKNEFARQNSTVEGGQLEMLIKQLDSKRSDIATLIDKKEELGRGRDSLRGQIENTKQDIFDERAAVASKLNSYYESFFPQVSDTAKYLLSQFEANNNCLVCGSGSATAIAGVKAKMVMNTCPVCESPIEHSDQPAHDPHAGEDIEQRRESIIELERQLASMIRPLADSESEYAQTAATLVAATAEVSQLEGQLAALGGSVPHAIERRDRTQSHLNAFQSALNQLEVESRNLTQEFKGLASAIDTEVQTVSGLIENSFSKFISGFLAESCSIKYTPRQGRIGQRSATESFAFPHFVPALTSGVHRMNATVREHGQSVSESQKEFVDLAFRMALLEIAAPNTPAMLILETPEASLDSVFVPRAADLLRRFAARQGPAIGTRLIASSNVNRELMIPALFGAYPDQRFYGQVVDETAQVSPPTVPIEEREKHVLDLLSIAVPTRALERFREPYVLERERALYPERFAGSPS